MRPLGAPPAAGTRAVTVHAGPHPNSSVVEAQDARRQDLTLVEVVVQLNDASRRWRRGC